MVTAKRAQLLLTSIYMVGAGSHSGQWRAGRRVTQSLGQLGKHDREEAQTPRDTAGTVLINLKHQKPEPSTGLSLCAQDRLVQAKGIK